MKQRIVLRESPSKTFRLEENRISGFVDGLKAVEQTVFCILNTERFDWLIYSWNYGVELKNLYGRPMPLVKARIKSRIRQALTQDDRITGVDTFDFNVAGRKLEITFIVHTKSGDIKAGKEVEL